MGCAGRNPCASLPEAGSGKPVVAPPVTSAAGVPASVPALSGTQAPAAPTAVGPAANAAGSSPPAAATPTELPAAGRGPATAPVEVGPGKTVAEPNDEAAQLFDPTKLHTFEVEIAPGDLETINTDPSAQQYAPARLPFEGQTFPIADR